MTRIWFDLILIHEVKVNFLGCLKNSDLFVLFWICLGKISFGNHWLLNARRFLLWNFWICDNLLIAILFENRRWPLLRHFRTFLKWNLSAFQFLIILLTRVDLWHWRIPWTKINLAFRRQVFSVSLEIDLILFPKINELFFYLLVGGQFVDIDGLHLFYLCHDWEKLLF